MRWAWGGDLFPILPDGPDLVSYNSISLSPVFTSHGVALGLIKTRQHSVPLGTGHDTHLCSSPQSLASLSIHLLHLPGVCLREAGQPTWPPSEVTDNTCRETRGSGQVAKAFWAELKHSARLQGSREATWPLMTLFGNQLEMSFLESLRLSMFWSLWNPLGIHPECREMVQASAGC